MTTRWWFWMVVIAISVVAPVMRIAAPGRLDQSRRIDMFTAQFWKRAAERAVKSAAQALIGAWTLDGFNVLSVDWQLAGGVAAGAAVLSLLTSIVSAPFGEFASPDLVRTGGK